MVLVDGTGLLYRAFHAIPSNLKTTAGLPTNAAFGFAKMFRKVLSGRTPAYGAVVFDAPGKTFRAEAFEGYKAGRPPMPEALQEQLPHVDRLVAAHNFPAVRVPGVEADDVLATLCQLALDAGHEVWIVSGDKDLAQLVDERVRLLEPNKEILYDADRVYRRWGVHPRAFPDWIGLVGDSVDGIPGVKGIGEKSASALLAEHGTLDATLGAAERQAIGGRTGTLLRTHAEIARQSRDLATLRRDVPLDVTLDDLALTFPTPEQLDAVYLDLEFFSMLSPTALQDVGKVTAIQYFVCDTPEMAQAALAQECQGPDPVALHVLHELPDPQRGALVGIAISPDLGRGMYFPFAGPGTHLGEDGVRLLADWLRDPSRPKVTHEGKQAYVALQRVGITLRGVVGDTALASYLVDPTKHLPHRLAQIAREYLHVGLQPIRGVIGGGRDRVAFADLTVDRAGAWACHNADAIGAAWRVLHARVREEGQATNLFDVDLPLSWVLGDIELAGVRMDPEVLTRIGAGLKEERSALRAEIGELAGRRFNPGSHKQLGTVLFEELGLTVIKRTKTGYSVDAEVMAQLEGQHPVVSKVLRWRTVDKLINTYTDVLVDAVASDGRIHATFQQTVSSSGRLITTEPDLQRTPVRTEEFRAVREAFVASPGCVLLSADWSQMELRLLAHVSADAELVSAYRAGRDVHRLTAAALFDVDVAQVSNAQREIGKTVNFATIYGQGPTALARQLSIPTAVAKRHIARFFERYAGVARWRDAVVADAYADGYVTTLLGRRRYISELWSGDPNDRAYGERVAMNTPIQGSGADLCKVAMLKTAQELAREALSARIVLQIHDELLLDVPVDELDRATDVVRTAMSEAVPLSVPMRVDVGTGRTWAEAH
ncbi:MAG: DNA polymerase I [Myxococcales bacterium]|nr:DNA polymerase I [Myxococcales bacterium]